MRNIFILTLMASYFSTYGQEPFMNFYGSGGSAKMNLDTLFNGNIWGSYALSSGTGVLDRNGTVIHAQSYAIDTFMFMQSIRKVNDNEFAFAGIYRKDSCELYDLPISKPALGRMDSLGNILSCSYYRFTDNCKGGFGGDLLVTEDNNILVWGRDNRFFAIRTDVTGSVRWAHRFANSGGISFIKELPGGDLIAGMNMDTAGAVVTRMTSDGNILWSKSYFRPRGMMTDCLIGTDGAFTVIGFNDSSATTVGFLEPADPSYQPKLVMLHLDGAGEVQWSKTYDSAPNYWYTRDGARIELSADGNAIIYGNIGLPGYNSPYRPFLMKTDLNGDTLWTRSYGAIGDLYNVRDVLPCNDGSILCSGGELWQGSFLFRTDTLGYLPCHNQTHQLAVTEIFPTDSAVTLSYTEGAEDFPAFLTPVSYPLSAVTDACMTGIAGHSRARGRIRIRPNPTPGRITVSFPDPLERDTYYSVIDATGRLLYQRPLPAGGTEEDIDLSRFGAGTYILRITDPDGQRNERVVVE